MEQSKIKVGVLGATGSVGQKFIELLANHPWFEITALAASDRSAGKTYAEAVNWFMQTTLPEKFASMTVQNCIPDLDCKIVFSGLDASVAGEIENAFARAGYIVVSNARNHRMVDNVPLLIPEVNASHLQLVKQQAYGKGMIVTNPNCSTIGLVMAIKPLHVAFGVEALHVVTMQALSGAGYPGVASLDTLDNVVPYISGEEEKMQTEPLKLLGNLGDGKVELASIKISAQCNRVSVIDGHLESVSVRLKRKPAMQDILAAWDVYRAEPQELKLPSAPQKPLHYFDNPKYPQPKLHRGLEGGMAVALGRLQECPVLDYKFDLLVHNTIRGAAGGAILNAELLYKQGWLNV